MNWYPRFFALFSDNSIFLTGPRVRRIIENIYGLWGFLAAAIVVAVLVGLRIWEEIRDYRFNERERKKK